MDTTGFGTGPPAVEFNVLASFCAPVSEQATIVRFADDLTVVVGGENPEDVEIYANYMMRAVKIWLEKAGLALADEKTEVVLITNRRKKNTANGELGGHKIVCKPRETQF